MTNKKPNLTCKTKFKNTHKNKKIAQKQKDLTDILSGRLCNFIINRKYKCFHPHPLYEMQYYFGERNNWRPSSKSALTAFYIILLLTYSYIKTSKYTPDITLQLKNKHWMNALDKLHCSAVVFISAFLY